MTFRGACCLLVEASYLGMTYRPLWASSFEQLEHRLDSMACCMMPSLYYGFYVESALPRIHFTRDSDVSNWFHDPLKNPTDKQIRN